jgi:hypothetical protein
MEILAAGLIEISRPSMPCVVAIPVAASSWVLKFLRSLVARAYAVIPVRVSEKHEPIKKTIALSFGFRRKAKAKAASATSKNGEIQGYDVKPSKLLMTRDESFGMIETRYQV